MNWLSWLDLDMAFISLNLILFILLLLLLQLLKRWHWSLSYRVLAGLAIGLLFGSALQRGYGLESQVLGRSVELVNMVGAGYVQLLQMLIYPLVLIFILSAVAKLYNSSSLGKIAGLGVGTLLLTTAISALIGALLVGGFNLSAVPLLNGEINASDLTKLTSRAGVVQGLNITDWVLSFIPKNPFADLTGARASSVLATAVFAMLLGLAVLRLRSTDEETGNKIIAGIDLFRKWIVQLIRLIMELTPYGVFALITKVVASTSIKSLTSLAEFLFLSYLGLGLILLVHLVLLLLIGLNPKKFFVKAWPALVFAFTSRSSAATIPLNIEIQTQRMGFPNVIASFVASFGATIGQNGCAGLYPAMLAAMVAPVVGINPLDPLWLISLVLLTTLSSIGIAGIGGGATFAALLVLPLMGLPIEIVAILVAIEPVIDMGRTAINVSGSMVAAAVTSQVLKQTDLQRYNAE